SCRTFVFLCRSRYGGLLFCALPPARPGRSAGLVRGALCVDKKRFNGARWGIYILGMALLAMGVRRNSLTRRGASAIVSVPSPVREATGLSFGDLTLIVYVLFVGAEFVIMGKKSSWTYLLQIPLSIVFTRIMNLIKAVLPYE